MTDDEQRASPRHRCRAGFGVELWIDPAAVERLRAAHDDGAEAPLSDLPERHKATEAPDPTITPGQIDIYHALGEVDAAA